MNLPNGLQKDINDFDPDPFTDQVELKTIKNKKLCAYPNENEECEFIDDEDDEDPEYGEYGVGE